MIKKIYNEVTGWVGQKINGISYNIDIVNGCILRCPSCAVSSIGGARSTLGVYMSIDKFRAILDKAQSEGEVRKVQFYAYSEAAMHPQLDLFVKECTERDIPSALSTMCQTTKCDWAKVVEARPTELRISFPGWNKMAYYQKNAKPELFDRKVEELCALPRYKETKWTMAFHLYNDNQDEIERARALAEKHRLLFVILPAIFMPLEKTVEKNYTEKDKELISHLLETPEASMSHMKFDSNYCLLWKQITLDANGDVYLCQLVFEDRFKLVNFLDKPISEIQKMIRTHSFCGKCMKVGAHSYQYCFSDFMYSDNPVVEANKKRHYDIELPT